MDKEKIKLIIKNMESLINCLKEEVDGAPVFYDMNSYEKIAPLIEDDYDEVFYDYED